MLGRTLKGRYRIITELGSGAFGETYLANDLDLPGTPLRVVKHFKPKDPNPNILPVAIRLFRTEAEASYRLKHEQIPELFAHFEENGEFYLVQDYIDGEDLGKAELTPGKLLSEAEVIKLLQDILEILAFVHEQDVIHRDIKPQNLIRRRLDGKLFLIDFGAVKEINSLTTRIEGQETNNHTIAVGTRGFMPSEQANGQPLLSSDVYAVGMIGIQALTGFMPHQLPKDPNTLEVVWRNQAQVSQELADILDKMVRYDFRQRYPSAVEALSAIKQLKNPTSHTLVSHRGGDSKTVRFIGILGGLVAIVGLVAIAVTVIKLPAPPPSLSEKYTDSHYKITLNYPPDWDKQEIHNIITKQVVQFISPENQSASFREKLSIAVEDLSTPQSMAEYTNSSRQEILRQNNNAKILMEGETTLSNNNAYRVIYTTDDGKNNLKNLTVWTLNNFKVYSITYTAKADEYDKYLNTAEAMIKSFKVEGK